MTQSFFYAHITVSQAFTAISYPATAKQAAVPHQQPPHINTITTRNPPHP
jgi:hypothetical protein